MKKTQVWVATLIMASVSGMSQAATLVSSGNWSDGAVWGGTVPSNEAVTAGSGLTLTLDSAVPSITYLTLAPSTGTSVWLINSGASLTTTSSTSERSLTLGSSRTATITQTGGTINASSGGMYMAYTGTGFVGTTTYDISGGSLAVGLDSSDSTFSNLGIVIARQGSSAVNISGTGAVTTTGAVLMGELGVSTASISATLTVADSGSLIGDMGLESGLASTNLIDSTITVSGGSISTGTDVNSGSWRLSRGDGSTTLFTQSGGTVTIGNDTDDSTDDSLYLGYGAGQATYNFTGGTMSADDYLEVGRTGTGNFTISGSAVANCSYFRTGSQSSAVGTSNINGGTINADYSVVVGVTSAATGSVTQTAGAVNVGVGGVLISGTSTAGTASYVISGGSLQSQGALGLGLGVSGELNITSSTADVSFGAYQFGANAQLSAVSGSGIAITSNTGVSTVNGNILGMTDAGVSSSDLAGLANLTLTFAGGTVANVADLGGVEVAGEDMGAVLAGLTDNFALAGLEIGNGSEVGAIKLIDLVDNSLGGGNEALYVQNLVVTDGSVVDLNGLNLYYLTGNIATSATFLNGTPTLIPEPASIALMLMGASMCLWRGRYA